MLRERTQTSSERFGFAGGTFVAFGGESLASTIDSSIIPPVNTDVKRIVLPSSARGLIFDCDGTIADTMPLHYRAWVGAMRAHGHDLSESMMYEFAGIPTRRFIELLNERHGYRLPVGNATALKERSFEELIPQVTPIVPIVELIRAQLGKLPMAVATGGSRDLATKTLAALDLLDQFGAIVTADDVEHGKPAPDIFLEAARRIGVAPQACVVFEDADLGVQAARSAQMAVFDVRVMEYV